MVVVTKNVERAARLKTMVVVTENVERAVRPKNYDLDPEKMCSVPCDRETMILIPIAKDDR